MKRMHVCNTQWESTPICCKVLTSGGQFYWYTKPGMPICRKVNKMKPEYVNLLQIPDK